MSEIIESERLREICQSAANTVTKKASGIVLEQGNEPPEENVRTVYTTFERGADFSLALTGEASFFKRICQRFINREEVEPEDIEEAAIEYFNVLCGGIAVAIFRATKTAVRFKIPEFCHGTHRLDGQEEWALNFQGDWQERTSLRCYSAPES